MIFRFKKLLLGATDGLSYSMAVVLLAPIVSGAYGVGAYAKVAYTLLLAAVGLLFNLAGSHVLIGVFAREGRDGSNSSAVFWAATLVNFGGALLFGAVLPVIAGIGGAGLFNAGDLSFAAGLAWVIACLMGMDAVASALLKGMDRLGLTALVEGSKSVSIIGLAWAALDEGSWRAIAAYIAYAVGFGLVLKVVLACRICHLRMAGWEAIRTQFPSLLQINKWQWGVVVSAFLYQQADRIFLASRLGDTAFATYNLSWQISIVVHSITAASLVYVLPHAARSIHGTDAGELQRLYLADVRLGVLVATCVALVVGAMGLVLISDLFLPFQLPESRRVFLLMVAAVYLSALSVVPYFYVVALGKLSVVACLNVAGGAAAFATAWLLVGEYGLTGVALSKIWGVVTLGCYVVWAWHQRTLK